MSENIHPIFDSILQKEDKEQLLKQKAIVVWMTGLSGSGKSTLARALENELHEKGFLTKLLDGDNFRTGLSKDLGFSAEDRLENTRRVAETAKLFVETGIVTICSFVSPTNEIRKGVKEIIGDDYFEVFVNCPFEVCAERDVKGLYAKAKRGEIKNFTGLDAPFDEPKNADLEIRTDNQSLEKSLEQLLNSILSKIRC